MILKGIHIKVMNFVILETLKGCENHLLSSYLE